MSPLSSSLLLLKIPAYTPLTTSTINAAYRVLALKYHPDSATGGSAGTFVELTESRDFLLAHLKDPAASPGSLKHRRPPGSSTTFRPASELEEYAAYAAMVAKKMKGKVDELKRQRLRNFAPRLKFGSRRRDGGGAEADDRRPMKRSPFADETPSVPDAFRPLTDALDRAFHGPPLSFSPDPTIDEATGDLDCNKLWPCSFELEPLRLPPSSPPLPSPSSVPSSSTITSLSSFAGDPSHLIEIISGRTLLGWVSHSPPASSDPPSVDCRLDLSYCGAPVLRATRRRVPDVPGGDHDNNYTYVTAIAAAANGAPLYDVADDGGFREPLLFGRREEKVKKKRRNVAVSCGKSGRKLYSFLFIDTPGVNTVYVRNCVTGNIDARLSLARNLPKSLWAWSPRSATHGVEGGWAVERVQKANNKHVMAVDFEQPMDEWRGGSLEPGAIAVVIATMGLDQ